MGRDAVARPNIDPFVGLFVAIATLMTAFFIPVFVILIDHGERMARIEGTVAGALGRPFPERMAEAPNTPGAGA